VWRSEGRLNNKRLRAERDMTQETLARKTRISRVHRANIESRDTAAHHRTPSLSVLERLARLHEEQ
jgi:transcriptional regulator with XRE-family HTH domain